MRYLLVAFIVFCSLFFWPKMILRDAQEIFYVLAGFSIILSMLMIKTRPARWNKVNLWVGIYGVYTILIFVLGGVNIGANIMTNVVVGILLFYATQQVDKKHTFFVLKAVLWVAIINCLYMAIQNLRGDFIYFIKGPGNTILPDAVDLIGLLGLKAITGIWIGLAAVVTLFINPILSLLFLIPIYIAKSTGVIIGLGLSIVFWAYFNKHTIYVWFRQKLPLKWAYRAFLGVFLAGAVSYVALVDSPMGMMGTRPSLWKVMLRDVAYGHSHTMPNYPEFWSVFLRNPITGFGLDSFRNGPVLYFSIPEKNTTIKGVKFQDKIIDAQGRPFLRNETSVLSPDGVKLDFWDDPHCELFHLFYTQGLLGVVMWGFIFYYMYFYFTMSRKTDELIAVTALILFIFGSSFAQFPLHLARIGCLFPVLGGLFVNNIELENKKIPDIEKEFFE